MHVTAALTVFVRLTASVTVNCSKNAPQAGAAASGMQWPGV